MTSQIHHHRGRSASPLGVHRAFHYPDPGTFNHASSPHSPSSPRPDDMDQSDIKQPGFLSPNNTSRPSRLSLNLFSRSRSADPGPGSSPSSGSKFSLGRALSRKNTSQRTPGNGADNSPPPIHAQQPVPQAPPPTYTESTEIRNASTAEDPYAFLTTFDTVFLIDDSGSMAGRSWRETQQALASIVPICVAHDTDGVDVYFLNHKTSDAGDASKGTAGTGFRGVRSLAEVESIFRSVRPCGATPTGTRIYKILGPYLKHYAKRIKETNDETCLKPLNIIVITDGAPSDDPDEVIVNFAKKLDDLDAPPYQVGIQFFQVGNEPGAAEKLRQLDDEISSKIAGGVRDMVDTATFDASSGGHNRILTGEGILKVVLGAVVKRLDRVESNLRSQPAARSAFQS